MNIAAGILMANDLLMAAQAVQSIINGAAMAKRDMTDAELSLARDVARKGARDAGRDLDAAIEEALARRAATE